MKNIKSWTSFNENNGDGKYQKNNVLEEIINSLSDKSDEIESVSYGIAINPYVHFVYNNLPFSISLTDRLGMRGDYRTILVIVEVNMITETLGSYNINEIDRVVDNILNYQIQPNSKPDKVFDIDNILDKICKSGMNSLTKEELDFLKTEYKPAYIDKVDL